MNKPSFQSIRSQLFVMVFIMALFGVGIIVYSGVSFRKDKINEALRESDLLADSLAREHERMVADARQLTLTLSQLSEIRSHNADRMRQILKEVLRVNPKYSNIFIADRAGRVQASAVPAKDTNVSDRRYFINALATGRFSSGEYIVSRFTGKSVLAFGYPFKDDGGKILGVIVMGIDMGYYRRLLDTLGLPSGSSYLLLDHKGTIMTRGIDPADFVGEQYEAAAFRSMVEGPDKDSFVSVAHDGIKRFISYRKIRLEGERTPYMYIRSGIPVSTALSVANRTLLRNLTLFTASLCFVVVFILLIAKYSIIDRIALLEAASKRLADGDLQVKISNIVSGGELGRLGITFDHMAGQIKLREGALRESHATLSGILNSVPQSIFWKDRNGVYLGCNENFAKAVAIGSPDRIIGKTDYDLPWPRAEADAYRADDREVISRNEPKRHIIEPLQQDDGCRLWIDTTKVPLTDATGTPYGVLGVYEDITERRQAEEALRNSEEKFRALFESATDAILILSLEGDFINANKTAYERLGYTREEMLSMHVSELNPSEFARENAERIELIKAHGQVIYESAHFRKDGTVLPVEVNTRIVDYEGRKAIFSIARDIAERKQAEEALRKINIELDRQLSFTKALMDSIPLPIFFKDTEGFYLGCNRAHATVMGYTAEDLKGKTVFDIWPRDQAEVYHRNDMNLLKDPAHQEYEFRVTNARGETLDVIINKDVFRDESGRISGIVGSFMDITRRKRAEEQIETSLREKEILLREIHHRVKNNLNVIASLLSLQSRYITEPEVVGIFEECRNRISSMALIHEKLYQTRNFSRIDFKEYLNSLISMLSSSYIHVIDKVSVLTDIQDLSLDIDTAMTCGLITNELVTNCLKHAFPENRGGVISIGLYSEKGKHILFVRDNGIGLPGRFDLMNTNTLGLQMVRMLTKQMEGTMHVAVDNGTEIRVSF